ncbi:MAG: OmpA family protein [Smithella sp.]|nr:OmpA family protein [Smithella sp.]
MKAITAKKVFMFVMAVFSINLMIGCAHMLTDDGCAWKSSVAKEEKVVILAAEPRVVEKVRVAAAQPKIIVLAFEDIHFDFDKSTLKPEARTILKRNIQVLKDNPRAHVRIAGYTSASGTEEYNQKLSERRAKAVKDYLIEEGLISSNRLTKIGYGESDPASYEAAPKELYSKAAKSNMRVLFEIVVE